MPVVVVESPAKAKTINKYLGPGHTVLASYGHVADLPPKDGSVDPENGFEMRWEVATDSKKHVKAIADALKQDPELILATDPDREGEAISWHLQRELGNRRDTKKLLADAPPKRVVFNQITKKAVTDAMKAPREVDAPLVEAYLARRALDYLVGFNLSPVLWRKLPGAKSAGRVQSVCLRLIVEREMEIEAFRPREYWQVTAAFETPRGETYRARLVTLGGDKLGQFDIPDAASADLAVKAVTARALTVRSVEAKPGTRNPSAPFMTSTLQQEASRKFGMGARQTMSAAQRLYEAGLITYMRTDGIDMAPEAVMACRDFIKDAYGEDYVPNSPRMYKNKAKNAQEAHECIRPTDVSVTPQKAGIRDADQRKLYDLVWKRTVACQMAAARLERTTVEIGSEDGQVGLRATGQVLTFDGFIKVYTEGRDDVPEEEGGVLPAIREGEPAKPAALMREDFAKAAGKEDDVLDDAQRRTDAAILSEDESVLARQSHTQPPPRYTEATLVKRMEELGIGRPSTYASIVTTIQDRGYVRKDKNRLFPEDQGRLVTAFLVNYFPRYVEYDFTAGLEEELDDVSAGDRDWKDVLGRFWEDFSAAIGETAELRIGEVLEKINDVLAPHIFPDPGDGSDPRLCPNCGEGRLSMRTARAGGAFIGCSNYPDCRYTRPFGPPGAEGEAGGADRMLGPDPDTGAEVWLKTGRFGPYVQLGEAAEGEKPKRASVPKKWPVDGVDLEKALRLLSLPRVIGAHPEDGETVETNFYRYGPAVKWNRVYAPISEDDVFELGMNRAVEELAKKQAGGGGRGRAAAKPLAEVGEHPEGGRIAVMDGRYGPYIKWEKVNATLPKDMKPEEVNLDLALELIAEKQAKSPKRKAPAKKAAKKPAAKKAAPRKAAAKKAPARKAAAAKE